MISKLVIPLAVAALVLSAGLAHSQTKPKTTHVIWVMTGGLRTQEVFQGADLALMTRENHVSEASGGKRDFWRETPEVRRAALIPFLWSVIAKQGQIYGNRKLGLESFATYGFNLSNPSYNESLTGAPDPRVNSNDKKNNPNVTVLEWLDHKPGFRGKSPPLPPGACFRSS